MSTEAAVTEVPQQQMPSSLSMIATLGGVATLSGVLIWLAVQLTAAGIERNEKAKLEAAVFKVLPGATERATFEVTDAGLKKADAPSPGGTYVYAGYKDGELVGVAVEASGQGYQDVVKVLFGYDPHKQEIIGFTVLASKETPGLGDRIGKDPGFLGNFSAMDVALNGSSDALANPITFVKNGEKTEPWQVEGISGATISSKAVAAMLEARCADILPTLKMNVDTLKEDR